LKLLINLPKIIMSIIC